MKIFILAFSVLYDAFTDNMKESLIANLSKDVNIYHRLFQNIDMPKLCDHFRRRSVNLLVQAVHSITNEYDVVNDKHLPNETLTFPVRGCNLTRIGRPGSRMFLTVTYENPTYNKNNDRLVLLICMHTTNVCHFMATTVIENFEQMYPNITVQRHAMNYLNFIPDIVSSIYWNHNIFKNIDMNRFCRDLRTLGLKKEQVQFNPQAQVNGNFNISKISVIREYDSTWYQIPAARNCKWEYSNGDLVYVTAPPTLPEYMLDVENTVVIFRCSTTDLNQCYLMCVVTISNFKESYPMQSKQTTINIYAIQPATRIPTSVTNLRRSSLTNHSLVRFVDFYETQYVELDITRVTRRKAF